MPIWDIETWLTRAFGRSPASGRCLRPWIDLDEPRACDPGISGAKGARLAAMYQAGFPVPEAIIVTTEAWSNFVGDKSTAAQVRAIRLPRQFSKSLLAACRRLNSTRFAVRSSGVGEDGYEHSMAGQLLTFLNTPLDEIPAKILECWAAWFSSPLRAYRRRKSLAGKKPVAVVVQRQIEAEMAGVVFTIDPLKGGADKLVLEWTHGLGDRLVEGRLEPRRCRIARKTGRILDNDSGLPAQVGKAAHRWGLAAESMLNFPADMEWAVAEGRFYVLQARPVTGIASGRPVAWTDVNLAENFPHPITPLAWSLVRRFYTAYMGSILPVFGWHPDKLGRQRRIIDHLIGLQGQRIYYCIDNWYAVLQSFPFSNWLTRFLDRYIGQYVAYRPPVPENLAAGASPLRRWFNWTGFLPRLLKVITSAETRLARLERTFSRLQKDWRSQEPESMPAEALARQLEQRLQIVGKIWSAAAVADLLVMIFPGLLGVLAERWLDMSADKATAELLAGQQVTSIQPSLLIWQMARLVLNEPALAGLLAREQFQRLEESLPAEARRLLDEFMDRFGSRCYLDCMVVMPTFREKHSLFWKLVAQYGSNLDGDPIASLKATCLRAQNMRHRVLAGLPPLRRRILNLVIRKAGQAVRLRERGRLLQSLLFGEMRPVILALGQKMVSLGLIDADGDVFYLRLSEILDLVEGAYPLPETLAHIIKVRKDAFDRWQHERPPEFFLAPKAKAWQPSRRRKADSQDEGALLGTPVSGGKVRAAARVIVDPSEGHLLGRGEVLVTYATDPGWTPLFSLAGGLILERGGVLSHGAIVAREFGIPAVAGIEKACERIFSGQLVRLDGDTGKVTVENE